MLGAEPEALHRLSGSFRSSADRLDSIAAELGSSLRRAGWRGPDADRFLAAWASVHHRALALLAERCRRSATELDRQAREQVLASAADRVGSAGLQDARVGAEPEAVVGAVSVQDPPRREMILTGGMTVGVGFGLLGLDGEVSIADLGDGRALVTWADDTALGLGVAAGGSLEVGVDGSGTAVPIGGAEVAATAALGVGVRRSWEVPSEQVTGLLAALAVERASVLATRRSDVPVLAGRAADTVVGFLTGRDPGLADRIGRAATSPPPTHVERLAGIDTAAAVRLGAAAAAGGGLVGDASGSLRVGERIAVDGSGRSLVLELDGQLAHRVGGSLTRELGLPDHAGDSRASLRIEVPDPPAAELHLFTQVEHDEGLTEQRVAVDLRSVAGDPELRRAIGSLRDGDPAAALAALSAIELPPEAVDLSVVRPRLERSGVGAAAGASFGPGAAVRAHGHVVEIRR